MRSFSTRSKVCLAAATAALCLSGSWLGAQITVKGSQTADVEKITKDGNNLFRVLSQTFDRVALTGERYWYSLLPASGTGSTAQKARLLRYRESISIRPKSLSKLPQLSSPKRRADFSLTLLEPGEIGAQMSPTEKSLRKAAFRDRSGFLHYQRDFRIQDVEQASKNYRVVPMGAWLHRRATGGPRVARIFDLFPKGEHAKSSGASIFRLVVDLEHQIVLDWIRFSIEGRLISALSYDEFSLGTNVSFDPATKWWKPWIDVEPYENTTEASRKVGFTIAEPGSLPQGFHRLEIRSAKEPILGTLYSVLIYTDGVRNFFLLQHRNKISSLSTSNGGTSSELVTVKRFRMGPVTQYDAEYKGMTYLLLGHEERGDGVPTLLQSLVR